MYRDTMAPKPAPGFFLGRDTISRFSFPDEKPPLFFVIMGISLSHVMDKWPVAVFRTLSQCTNVLFMNHQPGH